MIRFLAGVILGVAVATAAGAHAEQPNVDVIKGLIVSAAVAHAVDPGSMLAVARCESSYDPFARNGPNIGLYQLSEYGKLREFYARGYSNPFDPAQSSNFTAEQFAAGQQWAWSCWRLLLL